MWRGREAAGQDEGARGLSGCETPLCHCTDIGSWKQMFFGKSVSLGFLFCLARRPQNILGLMGVGVFIWKSLKSPCPLLVFDSENVAGAWLCGEFCFDLAVSLNFLPKRRLFWFCGRMAFGEKDNQRKTGMHGISFRES